VSLRDSLVVIADRTASPLAASISSVSRLAGDALRVARHAGLAEALGVLPGFSLVDRDGSGLDPQPIVRGFYGGGEAEYVVVLVDGKPMNALESGLMSWDLVSPLSVRAVEVVRGASSALYGDAALGGVINLITDGAGSGGGPRARLLAAGDGLYRAGVVTSGQVGTRRFRLSASGLSADGYRDHGERSAANVGGSLDVLRSEGGTLTFALRTSWSEHQLPGPLTESAIEVDRERSDDFHRFDRTERWTHLASLDGVYQLGLGLELSGALSGDLRRGTGKETLVLAPSIADTKERTLDTDRMGLILKIEVGRGRIPLDGKLLLGLEGSLGSTYSEYASVVFGDRSAYLASDGEAGAIHANGSGRRRAGAGFAQVELFPLPALRFSGGLRYDGVRDEFEPGLASPGPVSRAVHSAVSPKVGVNLRWIESSNTTGNVYLSVGRSFKAATPDQLYDQRSIPIPFPPFSATTSNPLLIPQRGTNLEVGAYQGFALGGGRMTGNVSVAVYQMDMIDELDFDLATLRYVNIGESRHSGVESGVRLSAGRWSAYGNYTLQSAVARAGANSGNSLKAIPRHTWSGGASADVGRRVTVGSDFTRASGAWLDDQNTMGIPPWTRIDVRIDFSVAGTSPFIEMRNALGATYSTTGFPDPSGSGVSYFFPSAGRTLMAGVEFGAH
jgi:outer membrane receptor protein involved in Fe transport